MQYITLEPLGRRILVIKAFYLIFRNPQLAILTCPQLKVHAIVWFMIANGIIGKDLKILFSTSCMSNAILDDNIDFVTFDKSNPELPQRAPV